ncbi:MAG: amidohydrolase family protein [Candidatus Latescibacterota bacterium]|nr:amidohydrolase family protein [Candidatus Latescibacterota bacterium]
MHIVDSHCHVGLKKYEPVESLLSHMQRSDVAQAVLIQYAGNSDNSYIIECMQRHPGRFAAAMIVDPDDNGTQIRRGAEQGFSGIRLSAGILADHADPLVHWRTAAELGLVVSAPSSPQRLLSDEFSRVLAACPDLAIVIEHLAGVGPDEREPYDLFERALRLVAERPTLTMKMPGFGEFCRVPLPFDPVPPLPRMALDALGEERLMWGSDYPPVSSREGYANSLAIPQQYFADLSDSRQAALFGGTAQRVWGLA